MTRDKTRKLIEVLAEGYGPDLLKAIPSIEAETAFLSLTPLRRHFVYAAIANEEPAPLIEILLDPDFDSDQFEQHIFGDGYKVVAEILERLGGKPLARDSYIALADLGRDASARLKLLGEIDEPSERYIDVIWHLHPELCTKEVLEKVWQRNMAISATLIGCWLEENMPTFDWGEYRTIVENGNPVTGALYKVHDYFLTSKPFPPPPFPSTETMRPVGTLERLRELEVNFDRSWDGLRRLSGIHAGRYCLYEHLGEERALVILNRDEIWGWCLEKCIGSQGEEVSIQTVDKIVEELNLPPIIFGCQNMGPGAISFDIRGTVACEGELDAYLSKKARDHGVQ